MFGVYTINAIFLFWLVTIIIRWNWQIIKSLGSILNKYYEINNFKIYEEFKNVYSTAFSLHLSTIYKKTIKKTY